MWNETAIELLNQQVKFENLQFSSVQSTITPLLHTVTFFFLMFRFNMFWRLRCVFTNTGGQFCSNTWKYRQTEQQCNGHTCHGYLSIVVVVPPTMRPSSIGFLVSRGTPEALTNIFITISTFHITSVQI